VVSYLKPYLIADNQGASSATDTSSTVGAGLGPIQTGSLVDRFKFFPSVEMLGIKRMPGTNSTMIKWSWSWIFPNSERNQSGVNLPGVGKLFSAVDRQGMNIIFILLFYHKSRISHQLDSDCDLPRLLRGLGSYPRF
jgi:hypothetical protein